MARTKPFHCTEAKPVAEILEMINEFRLEVSKLPTVSLTEITRCSDFDDLWPDFVSENRRWYELRTLMRAAGWTTHRCRCLAYIDGKYESAIQTRWTPPTESIEHFSPDPE